MKFDALFVLFGALFLFAVGCDSDVEGLTDADGFRDSGDDADVPDTDESDDADTPETELPDGDEILPDADPDVPEPYCGDNITQPELDEECDDGNENDEDTCSNDCYIRYDCPHLPMDCGGAEPSVSEHFMESIDSCVFSLVPQMPSSETEELIDELTELAGGALNIEDILSDLNRSATSGVTSQTAYRLRNHDYRGYRWNDGDMAVTYWYPQGMTGSSDANDEGRVAGRKVHIVSWYHKTEDRPTKGVRLSVADVTSLSNVDYRLMLLVEPYRDGSDVNIRSVETSSGNALHAGGIVWYGDLLFVADTTQGFRVFDLSRIFRVSSTDDTSRIGVSGTRIDAHGYRYAVPQLARYVLSSDSCSVRFSFVSLDRSSDPHALISGEYRRDDVGGRLVAWALDSDTGWLDVRDGEVRGIEAHVGAQTRMQGALRWEGDHYMSCSSQYEQYGRLYRSRPGLESRITAWVYGAEDLYYERESDTVWTPAEHPGARDTVGIPLVRP